MRHCNSDTWWRCTSATLAGASIWNYRRQRRDVLIGRRRYVLLIPFGDLPLRRRWVFHLRLVWDVLMGRPCDVLLRRRRDIPIRCCTDVPLTRFGKTWLSVSFETYLQRRWEVQRDVVKISLWRLVAGWEWNLDHSRNIFRNDWDR